MPKICLDAGHGGNDTGAEGPTGLTESSVALDLAQRVALELSSRANIQTLLTRVSDVFVELEARCRLANNWGADYFLSIHLNSDGPAAVGIETLYKSELGKSLAGPIQEALIWAANDIDRGLKQRTDLYVLNGTGMPAALTEVGFISHPETEAKFRTEQYRRLIVKAIVKGLADYLSLSIRASTSAPSYGAT